MGVLNNINYITSVSVYPCQLPGPWVLIETAISAGAPVLLELESWSCRDIMKLRAGISYRCGRQIKAIIKAAHGAEVIDRAHFIYKFFQPLDKLLWYWFVADLATSFTAHWTSLVYESQGCIPFANSVHGNGEGTGLTIANPGEVVPLAYLWTLNGGNPGLISSTNFTVPEGWYYSVHFTAEASPVFGDGAIGLTVYLEEHVGPFHIALPGSQKDGTEGETTHLLHKAQGQAGTGANFYTYFFKAIADGLSLVHGTHAVITISKDPILEAQSFGVGCFNRDWSIRDVEAHRL